MILILGNMSKFLTDTLKKKLHKICLHIPLFQKQFLFFSAHCRIMFTWISCLFHVGVSHNSNLFYYFWSLNKNLQIINRQLSWWEKGGFSRCLNLEKIHKGITPKKIQIFFLVIQGFSLSGSTTKKLILWVSSLS